MVVACYHLVEFYKLGSFLETRNMCGIDADRIFSDPGIYDPQQRIALLLAEVYALYRVPF